MFFESFACEIQSDEIAALQESDEFQMEFYDWNSSLTEENDGDLPF